MAEKRKRDKERNKITGALWRKNNPEKVKLHRRQTKLRKKYGINNHDYDALLAEQQGLCAICSEPPPGRYMLAVDHCHDSGKIRSLLCVKCNAGLGQFNHSIKRLKQAIDYLERWDENDDIS